MPKSILILLAAIIASFLSVASAQEQRLVLAKALTGPLAGVNELVFAVRLPYDNPHWYPNIG